MEYDQRRHRVHGELPRQVIPVHVDCAELHETGALQYSRHSEQGTGEDFAERALRGCEQHC